MVACWSLAGPLAQQHHQPLNATRLYHYRVPGKTPSASRTCVPLRNHGGRGDGRKLHNPRRRNAA
jgi:hypothetical protein